MPLSDLADATTLKHTTPLTNNPKNTVSTPRASISQTHPRPHRSPKMAREVSTTSDVLLYFLALFLPPLSVFLKTGCGADFFINILLSILGWLPGVIHAWYIISKHRTVYVEPSKRL